jgi:hypothetical protein
MNTIAFRSDAARRIYEDYLQRSRRVAAILSEQDRKDCLMELNSYIFEYLEDHKGQDEVEGLLNILERLGPPEVTLKEVVAYKKIDQAVSTFQPGHLLQALFLNLRNGTIYVVLAVMALSLSAFPVLMVMKLIYPEDTGCFVGDGWFQLGWIDGHEGQVEVLGNWFIPVMALLCVFFYFTIVYLLKLTKRNKK